MQQSALYRSVLQVRVIAMGIEAMAAGNNLESLLGQRWM